MMTPGIRLRPGSRNAFTLLEILLALGLTVVVLTIIFSAVYQYLFVLTRQQARIERQQVARGVMRMISDDLGGAIQYKPEDYSALENLIASQSLAGFGAFANVGSENLDAEALEQDVLDAINEGNSSSPGGPGSNANTDPGAMGNSGDPSQLEEEVEEEIEELGRPTLIGNDRLLRVDTSRLPRIDQYNPLVARRPIDEQLPSDVKTVTYFYSDAPPTLDDPYMPEFGRNGGLYRRRIDRAVETFLGDESISDKPDNFCELIAPEVVDVRFRYFDGEEWQDQWHSEELNGFPSAIEIVVAMDPQRGLDSRTGAQAINNPEELETLRTVVHLPVAEILPPAEQAQDQGLGQEESGR